MVTIKLHVIMKSQTHLLAHGSDGSFNLSQVHAVDVSKDRDDQSFRSSDSDTDVDVVPVNDFVVIDDSIDDRLILQRVCRRLHERRHESQFQSVFLQKGILIRVPHLDCIPEHERQAIHQQSCKQANTKKQQLTSYRSH